MFKFNLIYSVRYINTFEYFYKKQIRKDLIDKFNAVSVSDIDFSCKVKYKSYLKSSPAEKNFNRMPAISTGYLYYLESFFGQKVFTYSVIKKNLIHRDAFPDYFYFFKCSLNNKSLIFFLLQRFFLCLVFQRSHKYYTAPFLKFSLNNNNVLICDFNFLQTPWTSNFHTISNEDLVSFFSLNSSNLMSLFFIFDRLKLLKFCDVNFPLKQFFNPSLLIKTQFQFKTNQVWDDQKIESINKARQKRIKKKKKNILSKKRNENTLKTKFKTSRKL